MRRSWIIDTPGIKGFGLLDIEKEEVGHYVREIFEVARDCRYSNCIHMNEPGCAVNQAVKAIAIARGFMEAVDVDLICRPSFADIVLEGEEQRTAIRMIVETTPLKKE